jgi:hypothetical protein
VYHYCQNCDVRLSPGRYCPGCGTRGAALSAWVPGMAFGIDVTDGDPVLDVGDGIGIDLMTGETELEIAPGIDIPLW